MENPQEVEKHQFDGTNGENDGKMVSIPRPSSELRLFLHQVTGHNLLLEFDKETICKPLKDRELLFYKVYISKLQPFIPKFKGAIDVSWVEDSAGVGHLMAVSADTESIDQVPNSPGSPLETGEFLFRVAHDLSDDDSRDSIEILPPLVKEHDLAFEARSTTEHPWSIQHCANELNKFRMQIERDGVKRFISLENLTRRFTYPCVLDLKMGKRLYSDEETVSKKERKTRKALASTSCILGVRLGGMEVYDVDRATYRVHDKYFGRSLNADKFKSVVWDFLHDGSRVRSELVEPFRKKLDALTAAINSLPGFRFFANSLMLIYDGGSRDAIVDVRMVDFEHSTWPDVARSLGMPVYEGPDEGYLFGLQTIDGYLSDLAVQNEIMVGVPSSRPQVSPADE